MIDAIRPYPVYRDSGVLWLGEVPEHLEMWRLCNDAIQGIIMIAATDTTTTTPVGAQFIAPKSGSRGTGGADRDRLDPILDACVGIYREQLDEDGQVDFKGKAKAFLRTYGFLAQILPYTSAAWEKLSIFLTFLVPKLPAPVEEDLSKGILDAIDMDSYRVEKQDAMHIQLPEADRVHKLITEDIPAASRPTRLTKTPGSTPTNRTPASSTTRRWRV